MAKERRDSKNRLLQKGEYQKEDGRYMFRYTDAFGKVRYVYSWTLTKSDRTPKGKPTGPCLRDIEHQIEKDVYDSIDTFKAKNLTVNDYFEIYIQQKKNIKQSTRSRYKQNYNLYLKERIGYRSVSSIKYSDVCRCYSDILDDRNLSSSTMTIIDTVLTGVLKVAVRDNLLRSNPTDGALLDVMKQGESRSTKKVALTVRQQSEFMKFVSNDRVYDKWKNLFVVMLGTGCRVGEICGLIWNDCDFDQNTIHIRRTVSYSGDGDDGKYRWTVQTPKSECGERIIPMLTEVKNALQNIKKDQLSNGFCTSVIDGISGFIFCNRNRTILIPNEVNKAITRIVATYNRRERVSATEEGREYAPLPDFSPHILRHTFCTRLCESGIDVKVIQDVMGHSSIAMTMDVYNNITSDYKRETFKKIETVLKFG